MKNQTHPTQQPGTLLDASLIHKRVACERLVLGGTSRHQAPCPGKVPRLPPVALTTRLPLARVAALLALLLLPLLVACSASRPTTTASQTSADRTLSTALYPLTNPFITYANPYPVLAAATSGGSGVINVYVGSLAGETFGWKTGDGWSNYGQPAGGPAAVPPAVVSTDTGYDLLLVTDRTGKLSCSCDSGGWGVLPGPSGFTVTSNPGAVSWGGPRTDVMAWAQLWTPYGVWDYLQHDWATNNTPYPTQWSWELLPSFPTVDPTLAPLLVSRGLNRLDVFALGTDHTLHALSWNGSSWGQWQNRGGYLLYGQVAAVPVSASEVDVFGIGGDHQLYEQILNGTTWSGWTALGGYLITAPTAVSWASATRTVCALSYDDGMWCRDGFGGTWKGWYSIGGTFAPGWPVNCCTVIGLPPVSMSPELAVADVFAVSVDGQVWWQEGDGSEGGVSWTGWQSLSIP
jgi:hypothetical protein